MTDAVDEDDDMAHAKVSERGSDGRFVKGISGNLTGRPLGARVRLGESFLNDVLEVWEAKGRQAIENLMDDRPHDFVRLVSSLLPKNLSIKVNEIDELSDDELLRQLAAARQELSQAGIDPLAGGKPAAATQPSRLLSALSQTG